MPRVSSSLPIAKVSAGALAGAIVVILTWLLRTYAGVDLPGEVQSALTLIVAVLTSYLTPLLPGEVVIE